MALAIGTLAGCGPIARGHYAAVRGIRMYYEVVGRGKPLFLLHGGGGSGRQFARQIPSFARHFRLIVPDARAQGRSTDGPGPLTYHDMAEDLLALMDRLAIPRADILGWSDGGITALDLAIHHPERVDHLIAFGANFTPGGVEPETAEWIAHASAESFGPIARAQYRRLAPQPDHYEVAMNKILAMWRMEPNYAPAELRAIRARTTIATGGHDAFVRRGHTEELARDIPGARLWIVPDAGHGAIVERPDLVNRVVLAFLRDQPAE